MTEPSPASDAKQSTEPSDESDERVVTGGRYLYCLVDITAAEPDDMSIKGVGDSSVYIIESGTVGAVVHDSETIYDTENLEQVERLVLRHQSVVDTAGHIFGTPLPMRFNTILEGGDTSVNQWLHEHHDRIREELTSFAGTWEYRIRLFWEPSEFEAHVVDQDDRLQDLQQRQQQTGTGKAFLLEKQYDKRLRKLKHEHRTELGATLQEAISPVVNELVELEPPSSLSKNTPSIDGEQVAWLAVLADEDDEPVLGDRLDEFVKQDGVSIRFTGPWPPYTFAPDIG